MKKTLCKVVSFMFLSLILAACGGGGGGGGGGSLPPTGKTFVVSGAVTNGGASTIEVTGPVTLTTTVDSKGAFSLAGLPPGQYTVSAIQPGLLFTPAEQTITIIDNDIKLLAFAGEKPDEGLPTEVLEGLATVPERSLPDNQIILPNGQTLSAYLQSRGIVGPYLNGPEPVDNEVGPMAKSPAMPPTVGPQQKKNDIVGIMLDTAHHLACGRSETNRCDVWDFPADPSDPKIKPEQKGLTYIWGGKDPSFRTNSKGEDRCPTMTHGLDCSGLIYQVALAAGITLPKGNAQLQSNPSSWNGNIPADWKMKMQLVSDGSVEAGDIVGFVDDVGDLVHIGIAESDGTIESVNIISSLGQPNNCAYNLKTGPISKPMSELIKYGSIPQKTLRLVTTLSGDFDMYLRCIGRPTDAGVLRFTISNENGGPFQAQGTGIDYDGSPLCFNLNGTYDQINNIASGVLSFCNEQVPRSDYFSEKLLQDETGYFPLTKIIDNGGCFTEINLIRIQN